MLVWGVILLNLVVISMTTPNDEETDTENKIFWIDFACTLFFTLESIAMCTSMGTMRYVTKEPIAGLLAKHTEPEKEGEVQSQLQGGDTVV